MLRDLVKDILFWCISILSLSHYTSIDILTTFSFLSSLCRAAAAAVAAQTATGKSTRKIPPPLLRSRTLPAIIVPGISILHTQLNPSRLAVGKYTCTHI